MSTVAAKPKSLGELIQYYRQKKDISLNKLQELVGIDKGSLSRIENGEVKRPDFQMILSIAAALNIPRNDIVEQYIQIGHKSEVIHSILQNALQSSDHPSLITKIAAKFLESSNEDSLDLVEKLYQTTDSVEDTSIQLSLFNLIIDYSRNHGIMPYIAKSSYQKYMIERNDFSKLNETYQLGKNVFDYVNFLGNRQRTTFYYSLGIHAYSLMNFDDSVSYMKYVIESDTTENGEYSANAYINLCNSSYYTGDYEASQSYLDEYSKYHFSYVADNVKFMSACIKGKTGSLDNAISQLNSYLKDASEYNVIFAVTELLDLHVKKSDFHSAKMLLDYEKQMVKSLQDKRTTPFKRSVLARFYKLTGDLLQHENVEKSFDFYMKSVLEHARIGQYDKSFNCLGNITQAIAKGTIASKDTLNKLDFLIKSVSQKQFNREDWL
ncbi:helix-turn-helix domain-containing protein [Paenibacillus sp. OSY-SE]|uniref:helix-turn-helix domain-containing protein n=1 Tax=Paenibacillus sp. OSY-SE TaxID=1196323 RepID=UPI000303A929|nr:helix-turn-helix transcriptional regulator [Paenibacillus sp. OSY-SE]